MTDTYTPDGWNTLARDYLFGHLGIEMTEARPGYARARMPVVKAVCSPHGYLHAGAIVSLADSACGMGTLASLPDGAENFTTVELKSNHLGTTLEGVIYAEAELLHGGRTTQVWDAKVKIEGSDKVLALFRNTQLILYPRG